MQRERREHDHAVAPRRRRRARFAVHEARCSTGDANGHRGSATEKGSASSARDRATLAGRYYSQELDATYDVVANGTTLTVRRPRGDVDTLAVVDARTFRAGGLTYHFLPNVEAAARASRSTSAALAAWNS